MTTRELLRRLTVERFGPPQRLLVERYLPVPASQPGLCAQGPSVWQMALEAAAHERPSERAA